MGQSPLPQCFPLGSFPNRSSGTPPPSSASLLQPEPSRTTKLAYAAGPSLWHLAPQGCVFFGAHLGFWASLLPHCTLSPCPASPPLVQVAGVPCQYWPSDAGLSRIFFLALQGCPGVSRFWCQALMRHWRRNPYLLPSRCPKFGKRVREQFYLSTLADPLWMASTPISKSPLAHNLAGGGATWESTVKPGQL